ncbi:hypothetical protein [Streptomyces sp. NPDC048191]
MTRNGDEPHHSRAAKVKAELDGGTFVNRELGKQKFKAVAERW